MRLARVLFCILLACQAAYCSEEEIVPWRQAGPVWVADTREFGEVQVRVTSSSGRISKIVWQIGENAYIVPPAAFRDLKGVDVRSLELRWERGYDPEPWLYLVFRLPDRALAYIAFQNGRVVKRFIKRNGRLEEKRLE